MNKLKVGFATVNVAPRLGIPIQGYYIPRHAKGFLDDPVVDVLVLECDGKRIAMISIPVCTFPKALSDPWMEQIEAVTGIAKSNIFLSTVPPPAPPHPAPAIGYPFLSSLCEC